MNVKINKYLLMSLLFFITILYSCKIKEKVKVNIIGYTKLNKFEIKLNKNSKLIIDNKKIITEKIFIKPFSHEVILNNVKLISFKKIKLISNGKIGFISEYGEQGYKGNFNISINKESIDIINIIGIDDYFASVLGSEMGGAFSDEALKAQAVAIRTYYYSRKKEYKNLSYDINNADGRDIVYRGADFATKKMYKIMEKTKNLFLVDKKGKIMLPLFHSTSSGLILKDEVLKSNINDNITEPILLYDVDKNRIPLSINSPYFSFSEKIHEKEIIKIISSIIKINKIIDINLKFFNNTKCVDFIGFIDQNNDIFWIKAYKFLSLAQRHGYHNLRSIQFVLEKHEGFYYFTGKGFGHLCGMSQYSSEQLAKKGYTYKEILNKYYPNFKIRKRFSIKNLNQIFFKKF